MDENGSITGFILGDYLLGCLDKYNKARNNNREKTMKQQILEIIKSCTCKESGLLHEQQCADVLEEFIIDKINKEVRLKKGK
jgi:hypothetical protein